MSVERINVEGDPSDDSEPVAETRKLGRQRHDADWRDEHGEVFDAHETYAQWLVKYDKTREERRAERERMDKVSRQKTAQDTHLIHRTVPGAVLAVVLIAVGVNLYLDIMWAVVMTVCAGAFCVLSVLKTWNSDDCAICQEQK